MKKLLAIVISMAMIVAMIPVGVFADTTENCTEENCSHQAAIGTTHYDTLQEAVNAGGTVKLLKNVSNGYVDSDDQEFAGSPVTVNERKTVNLDLNGYTVTSYNCTSIINNGNLTIIDSSESKNGKVISMGSKASVAVSVGNNSKTIIDAGSFIGVEGAVITGRATGAEIKINNGKFEASDNAVIAGNGTNREGEKNKIEINDGTFTGGIKTDRYVACGIYAPWKDEITVNGGTFNITKGAGVVARAGNVTITGGTFNVTGNVNVTGKVGDSRVVVPCSPIVFDSAADYPAMADESKISVLGGTFKSDKGVNISLIKKEEDTNERIQVTGGTFSDLSALDYLGADANVTIQLKDSVTLEKPININSGKIILDLGGNTINVTKSDRPIETSATKYHSNGIHITGNSDLTIIGNGTIKAPDDGSICASMDSSSLMQVEGENAKLTILNGNLSAGGEGSNGMYGIYVCDGGNVVLGNTEAGPIIETWFAAIGENNTTSPANITVNNGAYTEKAKPADSDWWAYFCAPIYAASSGDITINGGTFNGYYGISTRYKKVEQNITISGGTFNGSKSAIFVDNKDGSGTTEAREIVVKGGTFSADPSAYVASGYYSAKNSDGKYTVYRYIPSTPADNVTNNTTDKNTTADLTPAVKDNKAETTVDAKTADKIVDKAVANKSTEVIVDATGNNTVASSEVGIPEKTVKELAEKTDANLVIKTDNGKVDLDKTALAAVAEQAGTTGTVRLVVETVKTDENICHVDLKLITSNGAVKDFRGGNVKVTINLDKELAAKELVCVYINDNGIYTLVEGVLNADGTYTFTTGHFSEYAVMAKEEADKKIAEQLDTLINEVNLKVRTSKTAKKNIKAVVSGDITALTDAGYTVKYKFYRSEKKASKYVSKGEKTADTYINTAGKKGTKYYYKAKALVYDGDKLVGQTVLKQCKYGVRTWSK